jgi:outer membrane protein assembly factor BamE
MRAVFAVLLLLPLAGCELVYKLPTRQGNVIEQKEVDKLALGMTRDQVRFVLGTPIATSGLREDRWDYFGYYKPPRGKPFSRTVSLFFEGDKLVKMEGELAPKKDAITPDVKQLQDEQKKAADEKERMKEEKDQDKGIIAPPKEETTEN